MKGLNLLEACVKLYAKLTVWVEVAYKQRHNGGNMKAIKILLAWLAQCLHLKRLSMLLGVLTLDISLLWHKQVSGSNATTQLNL